MSNRTMRRLVGGLGTGLLLLICAVVIGAHFLTGRNLQKIDVSEYTVVKSDGADGYTAYLDVDRLIEKERLHNPTATELDAYPEIKALRALSIRITSAGGVYEFETVTTGEDPTALLKSRGIKLVNTRWTLSGSKMETEADKGQQQGMTELRFSDYVVTSRKDGGYGAALDTVRMMQDAGIAPNADPATNLGAKALRSLGVDCQKTDTGYLLQTTSTLSTVMEDLKSAGLRIVHTKWEWTDADMESHIGTVTPFTPSETPESQAQTSEQPSEQPSDTPTDAPETPESVTPEPVTPTPPAHNPNAIDTLYGFDQTDVRKAIRAAKEQKYGSTLDASEVKFNYFAVGSDATEHANVFRIVYTITKTTGTEYLIADVYDLERETGYSSGDVHLSVEYDRNKAKSTDDLSGYQIHTLSGGSMVFPENKDKSPFDKDGLVMAKSISESVSYDELWDIPQTSDMTLLQLLGYARNEMFARGGHKFGDSSNYLKYYKQFDWYKPTGKVSADELAKKYPATKNNIATIKFLENLIKEG